VKKRDDLNDVIREEGSRGRKRPIDMDAIRKHQGRRIEVLEIFRNGTRQELRALLKKWDYSKERIDLILAEFDAARGQQSS
jgi:DNA polymerase II large subunit